MLFSYCNDYSEYYIFLLELLWYLCMEEQRMQRNAFWFEINLCFYQIRGIVSWIYLIRRLPTALLMSQNSEDSSLLVSQGVRSYLSLLQSYARKIVVVNISKDQCIQI